MPVMVSWVPGMLSLHTFVSSRTMLSQSVMGADRL